MDELCLHYQYMWKICVTLKLLLEGFVFEIGQWAYAVIPFENQPISIELIALYLCIFSGCRVRDCWRRTNMTSLCSSNSCHRLPFAEEPLLELFYPCNETETQWEKSLPLLDCERSQCPLCILKHGDIFPNHIMSGTSI